MLINNHRYIDSITDVLLWPLIHQIKINYRRLVDEINSRTYCFSFFKSINPGQSCN